MVECMYLYIVALLATGINKSQHGKQVKLGAGKRRWDWGGEGMEGRMKHRGRERREGRREERGEEEGEEGGEEMRE